jgi:hypothetical protein
MSIVSSLTGYILPGIIPQAAQRMEFRFWTKTNLRVHITLLAKTSFLLTSVF